MPGYIVVMRHGRAVPAEEAGGDENRWLTEEGRREAEAVARILPKGLSRVYTSPLRRARETAEIVARVLGVGVVVVDELAPGKPRCRGRLVELVQPGSVIVGHNPDLEELLCCLIGGGNVHLSPAAAAVVEAQGLRRGAGRLVELITPRAALAAGGGSG